MAGLSLAALEASYMSLLGERPEGLLLELADLGSSGQKPTTQPQPGQAPKKRPQPGPSLQPQLATQPTC